MTILRTTPAAPAPPVVSRAVQAWLAAILFGVAEAFVHLTDPEPPSTADLAVRFAIYLVLAALVLALRTGWNPLRWIMAGVLGVVGTASLVAEPIGALLDGASVTGYLAAATAPELLVVGLRMLHVVAVLVGLVLLFRPAAGAFFRR